MSLAAYASSALCESASACARFAAGPAAGFAEAVPPVWEQAATREHTAMAEVEVIAFMLTTLHPPGVAGKSCWIYTLTARWLPPSVSSHPAWRLAKLIADELVELLQIGHANFRSNRFDR